MRICSLLPSATEILYALDLGPSVVGVSHDCDYPPDVRTKTVVIDTRMASGLPAAEIDRVVAASVGQGESLYSVDTGRLAALEPDLIVTQALCDVCTIDEAQLARAVCALTPQPDVLTLTPLTLDNVLDDIERVGRATGTAPRAAALVASLRARIARVRARQTYWRPSVVCLEWLSPPFAAGHWVPEMVELAGGVERVGLRGEKSARVDWDCILAADPDIVIVMPCGFECRRRRQRVSRGPIARRVGRPRRGACRPSIRGRRLRLFLATGSAAHRRPRAPRDLVPRQHTAGACGSLGTARRVVGAGRDRPQALKPQPEGDREQVRVRDVRKDDVVADLGEERDR